MLILLFAAGSPHCLKTIAHVPNPIGGATYTSSLAILHSRPLRLCCRAPPPPTLPVSASNVLDAAAVADVAVVAAVADAADGDVCCCSAICCCCPPPRQPSLTPPFQPIRRLYVRLSSPISPTSPTPSLLSCPPPPSHLPCPFPPQTCLLSLLFHAVAAVALCCCC